nr:peptidoglycan-binding protein [Actinomycetales bacterium]
MAEYIVRRRRWPAIAVTAVIALVLGAGAGWWSARTLLQPPPDALADPGYVVAEARWGEVGQNLRLNTRARWDASSTVTAAVEGVVTVVPPVSGRVVHAGDRLYDVGLRPVVIAQGPVPGFRGLSQGAAGDDVRQLQEMLATLGYLNGAADGVFGDQTRAGVIAWQRSLGLGTRDGLGTVRAGDIVYVPILPSRIHLSDDIAPGFEVAGRTDVLSVLREAPTFEITLGENQSQMVGPGMDVVIEHPDGEWLAIIQEVRPASEQTAAAAVLAGKDGAAPCGEACDAIPVGEGAVFPARIDVVPTFEGVTVPTGALHTDASGRKGVVLESGEFVEVEVLVSAHGTSAVEG